MHSVLHRHRVCLFFFLLGYFVETVRFGTDTEAASIVEIAMDSTHVINCNDRTMSSGFNRTRVVAAHSVELHSCTGRVLFFQLFNSLTVRKNHLLSLSATHFL